MNLSFHTRTVIWLATSSILLGSGLYAAFSGQQRLAHVQSQRAELLKSEQAVAETRRRAENYQTLIERIGWRPGQSLRHETIDTSALIAGHETDRLNEILRANHVGKGQFFLRSLTLEAVAAPKQAATSVRVSLKGDNILVLDRP